MSGGSGGRPRHAWKTEQRSGPHAPKGRPPPQSKKPLSQAKQLSLKGQPARVATPNLEGSRIQSAAPAPGLGEEPGGDPRTRTHVLRKRVVMPCTSCTTSPCRTGLGGLLTSSRCLGRHRLAGPASPVPSATARLRCQGSEASHRGDVGLCGRPATVYCPRGERV